MDDWNKIQMSESPTGRRPTSHLDGERDDRRLLRWAGLAGLGGFLLLLGSVVVVVSLGLPDASDIETLNDFGDIEAGRVAEHFFYLGALVLFALNVVGLQRVLRATDTVAPLFGSAIALFGLVIMAASSMLHVSTRALVDLTETPGASPDDVRSIEHAWTAAQSVFDTMLATGVLLVPIGLALLGVAMRGAPAFGPRLAAWGMGLGVAGFLGAAVEIIDSSLELSAIGVLAIAVFHATVGWHMLRVGSTDGDVERDGSDEGDLVATS